MERSTKLTQLGKVLLPSKILNVIGMMSMKTKQEEKKRYVQNAKTWHIFFFFISKRILFIMIYVPKNHFCNVFDRKRLIGKVWIMAQYLMLDQKIVCFKA